MGQVMTWQVEGMDCEMCERRLQTALGRLDGVGQVDADHAAGRVAVRFDASRIVVDELAVAVAGRIEQAGFTVTDRPHTGGQETKR